MKKNLKILSLLLAFAPAVLAAQQTLDSRWLPWLGCWQVGEAAAPENLLVCLRPSSDQRGVEVATVSSGEVAATRTLTADGQPHDVATEQCTGSQFAEFSRDGYRVFLWSTLTCDQGRKRTASAIMAMGSRSEWLDVQAVGANGDRMPRVLRYQPAAESRWPAEFLWSGQRADAVADARLLAATRVSLADIEEAASHVDHEALTAFILEKAQRFDLSAQTLAAMQDAGTPNEVIDALVAASYPERFAVDREALATALKPDEPREAVGTAYGDPFGWGWWGSSGCYMGYWSPYCGSFYYGMGYGYGGYLPYWYDSYGYGGYWGRPVIVVRDPNAGTSTGTAVRGRGFTRGGQPVGETGGRYARPRGGTTQDQSGSYSPSVRSGSSSGGGTPSASPSGYTRSGGSSSSGSSSGTAKPKPKP